MLRIRLSRHGAKKNPHYRVVVAEKRNPRDGRYVEVVGHYSPAMNPKRLKLNLERVDHWLGLGARPSQTVVSLIDKARTAQEKAAEEEPEAKAETSDSAKEEQEAKAPEKEESKKEAEAAGEGKSETEPQEDDESKAEEAAAEA